ncbi:MAG: hypothetical protein Q9201_007910, partial [Fulgogasparrea decipioides]
MQNIAGLNGGKLIGFSEFTLTIDPQAGTRSSSETSFLQESLSSSTLQVYHESIAQKIIFSEEKTATGVKVVTAGTEYTLSAIKEVILAPGVVFMATSTLPRSCGWEKLPQSLRSGLSNSTLTTLRKFPSDWPEIEILPLAATTATVTDTDNYFSVSIAVLTTTSRGNITINSTNTMDNPLVSPNWLLTTTDQELAIQGFKRAREIANATGIIVGPETSPGPQVQTDAQILEFIKESLAPIHHAVAT